VAEPRLSRFDLFELAAQDPPREARFLRAAHGGDPLTLGDDFAGPASIARAWIPLGPDHRAIATDRDPEPLDHARRLADRDLGSEAHRLTCIAADVLEAPGPCDVIAALNFAAGELHTRDALLTYLRHALCRLAPNGVLVVDTYGGPDALIPGVHEQLLDTDHGRIVYEWEQRTADPLTARVRNAMHFTLPSGDRLRDAFVYDWRLWTVAELTDAMLDAGFRRAEVHTALAGAIDGEGRFLLRPDNDPPDPEDPFVAYIVGRI